MILKLIFPPLLMLSLGHSAYAEDLNLHQIIRNESGSIENDLSCSVCHYPSDRLINESAKLKTEIDRLAESLQQRKARVQKVKGQYSAWEIDQNAIEQFKMVKAALVRSQIKERLLELDLQKCQVSRGNSGTSPTSGSSATRD